MCAAPLYDFEFRETETDAISKVSYIIANRLIDAMNGTVEFNVERTWGYKDPKTGAYSGMTGQLQRQEVDLGGTVMFMTPDRVEMVEYLSMTTPTRAAFVFRAPPLSYVSNIYYLPFQFIVWICTVCLVILCTIIIYVTFRLPASDAEKEAINATDFMLMAVGSVCQMGSQLAPKILSARISIVSRRGAPQLGHFLP